MSSSGPTETRGVPQIFGNSKHRDVDVRLPFKEQREHAVITIGGPGMRKDLKSATIAQPNRPLLRFEGEHPVRHYADVVIRLHALTIAVARYGARQHS
jgi:hypothetical protein